MAGRTRRADPPSLATYSQPGGVTSWVAHDHLILLMLHIQPLRSLRADLTTLNEVVPITNCARWRTSVTQTQVFLPGIAGTGCATTSCGGPLRICHAERSEASGQRMVPALVTVLRPDPSLALRMTGGGAQTPRDSVAHGTGTCASQDRVDQLPLSLLPYGFMSSALSTHMRKKGVAFGSRF
jgi:hypothetical protein